MKGFDTDLRDFTIAVKVLEHLNIKSINLLSNNPEKIKVWDDSLINVTKRVSLIADSNEHNIDYLAIKKSELNHMI